MDKKPHILFDANKVETWELMALEGGRLNDMIMIFSRHLAQGDNYVSPGLPSEPLDELSEEQREEITSSEAYRTLRRLPINQLRKTAETFVSGMKNLDPN